MDPPTEPTLVQRQGRGRPYQVIFVEGVPYPWHPLTGIIWRVNWQHWEEYERIRLKD